MEVGAGIFLFIANMAIVYASAKFLKEYFLHKNEIEPLGLSILKMRDEQKELEKQIKKFQAEVNNLERSIL